MNYEMLLPVLTFQKVICVIFVLYENINRNIK